jgi:hypothetical protein
MEMPRERGYPERFADAAATVNGRVLAPLAQAVPAVPPAANVAWPTASPPLLPVSSSSTSDAVPTSVNANPIALPLTVSVPEPVPSEALQPSVPVPVAIAEAGAFVTVAPFSVPEHVPEPLKLKPLAPGTRPSGELNVAFPLRTHSPETVLAALADAAGTITNAAVAADAIRNLLIDGASLKA